ncbi:MAG: HPF/RaiA family ribosome-associated protein [Betaproteobacteria bacterium]|jgi:ribosomal subunit interface protein|nr:ribosome-associated translation inhibitor RaiA [Rhodocyclaceae bacterium]MCA3134163.1 ribosome-associated translation inhibitor RaiA [Rhodocyclaceae bacterium]MCA3142545.1 ribosome-associated translation inhibitor RaiA [Rhodocyclaceae bacterium]MCA3144294.1 ribosome-associated translation inhibitor RaiA [Rhodocyclaceae bacterium]MCE2899518.1 HPF/RaiA family ribosome-associated protein [Betaproteobacteria bacterium]
MQTQLQITFRDTPHSDALENHIREKVRKLESIFDHIQGCHVTVEQPHRHKHQGKHFCVHIDLRVPGSELVANLHHHEDPYVALRDAFDAAKRQLEDYTQRLRGEVKRHDNGRREPAVEDTGTQPHES